MNGAAAKGPFRLSSPPVHERLLNPYASPMDRPSPLPSLGQALLLPSERPELASPPIQLQRPSGGAAAAALIRDLKKFKSSASPSRILFFRHGSWSDFPQPAFDGLSAQFAAGRTAFELAVEGRAYVFDFLGMSQVDIVTGAANSIAWIDIDGRCFFPAAAFDERSGPLLVADMGVSLAESPKSDSDLQEGSGDSGEGSTVTSLDGPRWIGAEALGESERCFKVVQKLFLTGLSRFAPNTVVTAIRKCSRTGHSRASRLKAFALQAQMTKAARGDANVKFGWYGASTEEAAAIIAHGFGQPNCNRVGSDFGGVGVHLSAAHCPYLSAFLPESDANDCKERHMILCRVIIGKMERVEAESSQYHPSSEEFDSGVDDVEKPRWYVVWSTHMNTHIIPECIVTYKCSKLPQTVPTMKSSARNNVALNLQFSYLLAEIGRTLPSPMTQALQIMYSHYKGRRISKEAFVRYIRSIVGDKVIRSIMRKIRGC